MELESAARKEIKANSHVSKRKVAKDWGKKFATGSSVTKTASGTDEIVVQGDNSDDIFDIVVDTLGVPEDNVECIEDKKKKSG